MKDVICQCQCGDIIQPNDDALCGNCALEFHANKRTIESLKREIATLKEALEKAQADNRSLVEQMNGMAISTQQLEVIRMTRTEYIKAINKTNSSKEPEDVKSMRRLLIVEKYVESLEIQCESHLIALMLSRKEIARLQADNRSLVEQMNVMALKPNQEVIEWIYTLYNPVTSRIYNLPTEGRLCIIELFSGKYDIVWWISDGLDETGWDGYGEDDVKRWAYLPKGV